MASTILTATGWEKNGTQLGLWTNRADLVDDPNDGILVNAGVTADALAGADSISGSSTVSDVDGISNSGTIDTSTGNDKISGTSRGSSFLSGNKGYGIFNNANATINTGAGDDTITSTGTILSGFISGGTLYNLGAINTGTGNDAIDVTAGGSYEGTPLVNGIFNVGTIDTGEGSDTISATNINTGFEGGSINNSGTIETGDGRDKIIGGIDTGRFNASYGIINQNGAIIDTGESDDTIGGAGLTGISNSGTINTGTGKDTITADGVTGIRNSGAINTGGGSDTIAATASFRIGIGSQAFVGIDNSATINTGDGSDIITGDGTSINSATRGKGIGISNNIGATINTGDGSDIITGNGTSPSSTPFTSGSVGIQNAGIIDTGIGSDTITAFSTGTDSVGLNNKVGSIINTGDGRDTITGTGVLSGILNDGIIDTGAGIDIVDALNGGFAGTGTIKLGDGADTLKGFGSGFFDGGRGKDTLILSSGTYTVGGSGGQVTFTLGGITMNTTGFELLEIGGNTYDFAALPATVS
jgi:hypothetical protein